MVRFALFAALFDKGSLASVCGRFGAVATAAVRGGSVEAVTACNITLALDALVLDAIASGQHGAQVILPGSAGRAVSCANVVY